MGRCIECGQGAIAKTSEGPICPDCWEEGYGREPEPMTDTQAPLPPIWPPHSSKHSWPEDFEHENGNYNCVCGTCDAYFIGHKRRVQCKACFLSAVVAERDQLKALSDDRMQYIRELQAKLKALEVHNG